MAGNSEPGHSRESSVSGTSSDSSLVLSVSALSRRGPAQTTDSLSSEASWQCSMMGGAVSNTEEGDLDNNTEGRLRLEPEGIEESDFTSFLSVDKRLFGRLQEELTQAQSELKLKEEQVMKLSRIRDDVEREMEDLTASLFQEAHRMVQEANVKRAQAEKALAESEMKVDGLETEVSALKALVITSTPSHPNLSHHRATADNTDSAPSSPSRGRPHTDHTDGWCGDSERNIDPTLRQEYVNWKKSPELGSSSPFLARIYREDVEPCLAFPASELSSRVRAAIQENILCLSPIKPDTGENPRDCALLHQPRTVKYKLKIDGEKEDFYICQLARNRVASVCDFLTYCRYVTQGMVKSPINEVYWEIMDLRKKMCCARLGFNVC